MTFSQKVSSFITEKKLIFPKDNIIVAVSGGRDSVCLLHILNSLKETFKFELSAIHINHGTRGVESGKDEQFVLDLCQSMQIDCANFNLSGYTSDSGENALRIARYAIFEEKIANLKKNKIATAHHLNDQLETFLMRIFKGSGVKGLLGIPYHRVGYIRPLLRCTRQEIDTYCAENKIDFREDLSNKETEKLRNNIRHNLVPTIQNIFGHDFLEEFQKSHLEFIELYRENYKKNKHVFKKISKRNNTSIKITISKFSSLSPLKKRQFLDYCISYVCGLNFSIGKNQLFEFELFAEKAQTGSHFLFCDEAQVLKNRDQLIFNKTSNLALEPIKLIENSAVEFGGLEISIQQVNLEGLKTNELSEEEIISGDNISFPLEIRNWQQGDYFYPLGKNKKQKLSDFFINNKISKDQKSKVPLLLNKGEIIWVAGYRISDKYKITKNAKSCYKLEIKYD